MSLPTDDPVTPPVHGAVTWLTDMNDVALQVSRDTYGFYQYLSEINGGTADEGGRPGVGPQVLIAALGVGAQFQANIIAAANLGNSIAQTVLSGKSTPGELQINVINRSSCTVTCFNYTATGGPGISNVPDPLFTGQSDVVTITDDSEIEKDAKIDLDFSIGNGAPIGATADSSIINFNMAYQYSEDDSENERWFLTAAVDGSSPNVFPKALQMFGFTYAPTDPTQYPGFGVYTGPVETGSGSISMVIYDR
ncbi:hypothetical protein ABZ953_02025 [Streptomyces sp. NPDC046465]|uniref:hypothetical protein n=1 Tax=Streptomyces sp. NPDC046465 TaxID=3155810 RepID=UPI0033E5B785